MKKEFFDFDKLFEEFVRAKYLTNKKVEPEFIRAQLGKLYDEWSQTPAEVLSGVSPARYFLDVDDPSQLVGFLTKSCQDNRRPSSFLLDKISELPETAPQIRKLISENNNPTLTLTAIELLQAMNAAQPLEDYIEILKEGCDDAELKEAIIQSLTENAEKAKESLLMTASEADQELKTVIAEILINAQRDERTFELLRELFRESDNIPLISSYIGKYGDERLATDLYKALKDCNYLEYKEIKNAIERMGGTVEDTRDFTEDIYYKIIKEGYKT